jgi:serine/threonine-protein kinase
MGVVAECTHLALNERVAIKMLRQDVLADQDAVSRFIREAQAAVKLKSEYVARVSDVGTFENGVPYMVMEFLEGHDMGELLKERGVLPTQWATELMLQTAEALAEAHSLGIVHRDVKPTNLFVTWRPDGSALIKVLDFGISKSPLGTDMQLTQTQSLLGTPAYMSPEQMRSARLVDTRTDIWSLGTVFYEALEGRRPFEAESFSEMCVKVAVDAPAPMINAPAGVQQIVMRCLAKAPEQRYANMAEFAGDLVPFCMDPHGAQMLVDRMTRMLRRSTYDWEGGGTGTRHTPIPASARDFGSGPVRTQTPVPQQWSVGSDPAGSPWSGKSDPNARPWHTPTRGEASQPFATPLRDESSGVVGPTVYEHKRSKLPLILALFAVLGVGAAAAAYFVTTTGSKAGQPQPAQQPAAAPTEQPTPDKEAVTKPEAEVKPSEAPTVPVDEPKVTETNPKNATKKASKTSSRSTTRTTPKQPTTAAAPPPTEPEPVKEPPKVETKCDPFDSMHGCK